jgi:predicted TIM-barrel enzyme
LTHRLSGVVRELPEFAADMPVVAGADVVVVHMAVAVDRPVAADMAVVVDRRVPAPQVEIRPVAENPM